MQLGKASAYATFATVFVAQHQSEGPVNGRRIAEAYGIPPEYLLKILQQLVRAQVLRSETGRRGGFVLRKSADQTTLLEIVEAIEGPVHGELPVGDEISGADVARERIAQMCAGIAQYARNLLREASVQDLMDSQPEPNTAPNVRLD